MSTSLKMLAESTSGRVHRLAVDELPQHDEVAVRIASPNTAFEEFLAAFSATLSNVESEYLESEIARLLDQLAQQMGAERCTVGEFNTVAHAGFGVKWIVGKDPAPLIGFEDSWIGRGLASGQSVSISTLDDLPAEAVSTRQVLAEMGIRSGLWVPIMAEASTVGGFGLTVMSHDHDWPALVIRRCQVIGNMIGDALLRRRRAGEIKELLQFEALITNISTTFLNIDADIDAITDDVLGKLGEFLGADRVGYLEVNAEENSLVPTRQWYADGIEQERSVQYVDVSAQFPWLAAKIMRNEPVKIDAMDQFPDEATNERQYCENLGIKAFTMVPATLGGKAVAALALDNLDAPQIWTDGIVQRLQIVTGMIASALERTRQQREIEDMRRFQCAISAISTEFLNLPAEMVDDEIERGLSVVIGSLGADHITLLQPHGQAGFRTTHEWSSEKNTGNGYKGTVVDEVFPWLADQLRQKKTVAFSKLSELPEEATNERNALEQMGHESVIFVPFEVRGVLGGYIGVDRVEQTTWSEEIEVQLRRLGEIFGEALSRRGAERQLRGSLNKIEALKEKLQNENIYLRHIARPTINGGDILGNSASLVETLKKVEQVAATASTVLILGETGTGKELVARAIHDNSACRDKLLIKVNCAALPSSLVEAELFGREKGAYTGALTKELGRFEIADGSTILLDEIGELSLELQAKLLRVLQDGEFERLGSSKTRKVDVRVLAATNRDLDKAVENKEFREDLFYRLNVFPIVVPPLRDRVDDIPMLVWAFVQEFSESMGKTIESIPVAAMDSLKKYSWPGNVREVRNIVERAMIMSNGPTLEIEPLGGAATSVKSRGSSQQLADIEREHIQAVVETTGWRVRGAGGAAEILGLKPTTLEARMKKLGLQRAGKR
jgi:transcriptional regulator with GAF, ATPase, and Fis domain